MSAKPQAAADSRDLTSALEPEECRVRRRPSRHPIPIPDAAVERMVSEFIASRGGVTVCPPAYVAPTWPDTWKTPVRMRRYD